MLKSGGFSAGWLDRLVGAEGLPILRLPIAQGTEVQVGKAVHPARVLPPVTQSAASGASGIVHWAQSFPTLAEPYPSLRLRPSDKAAGAAVSYDVVELGPRLRLGGDPDMQALGEALHSFFAADRALAPRPDRMALASRCLSNWMVAGALTPEDVVEAADRLWRWCGERWPGSSLEREVPVTGRRSHRRIWGRIDLLVRSADGLCLVDHKAFPGGRDAWADKVAAVAPQLELYAEVCRAAGETVAGRCIHLPVAGVTLLLGGVARAPE
jgi:hypothetical protein